MIYFLMIIVIALLLYVIVLIYTCVEHLLDNAQENSDYVIEATKINNKLNLWYLEKILRKDAGDGK